jgi:hypothetical protein
MALLPRAHMIAANDYTNYKFEIDLMPNGKFNFRLMFCQIFMFAIFKLQRENVAFATYEHIQSSLLYIMYHSYEFVGGMFNFFFLYTFL